MRSGLPWGPGTQGGHQPNPAEDLCQSALPFQSPGWTRSLSKPCGISGRGTAGRPTLQMRRSHWMELLGDGAMAPSGWLFEPPLPEDWTQTSAYACWVRALHSHFSFHGMIGFCHGPQATLEPSTARVSASASAGIADQRHHLCLLKRIF